MDITVDTNIMDEIFVNDIPIGFVILNKNRCIERAEMYCDNIHTLNDAKMVKGFIDKINEYSWVDSE